MACEVARSAFAEHTLDESFVKTTEDNVNFDFADFEAKYCNDDSTTINPQDLSNAPSPAGSFNGAFNSNGIDHTLSPEPTVFTDFITPQTPYFLTPTEQPSLAFSSSGLRHQFRRSVSEPPDGILPHHRHAHSEPQMVFTRDGHRLGDQELIPRRMKSLPKGRQQMRGGQPYKMKLNAAPIHQQQRYQLRRSQTQPSRPQPPRSTPMPPPSALHPYPQAMGQHQQQIFEPLPSVPEQGGYISSRVCTPTAEEAHSPAPIGASPRIQIDPALTAGSSPTLSAGHQAVTVSLTVDALRGMIEEAMKKAMESLEAKMAGAVGEAYESKEPAPNASEDTPQDVQQTVEEGSMVADVKK